MLKKVHKSFRSCFVHYIEKSSAEHSMQCLLLGGYIYIYPEDRRLHFSVPMKLNSTSTYKAGGYIFIGGCTSLRPSN